LENNKRKTRAMIVEKEGRYFRDTGETMQEVYWNETFEEWTPVLWEQQMEI